MSKWRKAIDTSLIQAILRGRIANALVLVQYLYMLYTICTIERWWMFCTMLGLLGGTLIENFQVANNYQRWNQC
eukprot:g51864.t1